jgi:Fe-S-cluster containining protein
MAGFACPPDCGYCCTHLERDVPGDEAYSVRMFHKELRGLGVYHCDDGVAVGLSISNAEAEAFRRIAKARKIKAPMHPRTFLLETRRRLAVVVDWHFPHVSCPFYQDYKCTVYDDRPLVCRAFPVMAPSPRWSLAPSCPKAAPTMDDAKAGTIRLGTFLRVESKARRAIDEAHATLDTNAMLALDKPGARFAKGLDVAESMRRAKAYKRVALEAFVVAQQRA